MDESIGKLSFLGPVHFGEGRLSGSGYTFDAATFFSALYLEALRSGCAQELLAAVQCGDIAFSDAFPYVGDMLYLPKPMVRPPKRLEINDSRSRKAAKKLDYIPADRLGDYLSGNLDPVEENDRFDVGILDVQTKVILAHGHSKDAKPYHVGSFSFKPGAGAYVVLRGAFAGLEDLLLQLGYSGIGGKRSIGFGRFKFSIEPLNLKGFSPAKAEGRPRHLLLSTATPTQAELSDALLVGSHYKLVRRGGFVQSTTHHATPQKKRDLYLFAAGSVFTHTFSGDVFDVNVTPGAHSVLRYARAMWMEV